MAFIKDFAWGTATAAYQIEGAHLEDGKGLNIWDVYTHEPGIVTDGYPGDTACDHYHRFREDVKLMKELGHRAYRFSISWSRLIPEGTGALNPKGVQFYSDLIDCLLENGIEPHVTLFHWDYPYALHRKGGWLNDDSVQWFADYAAKVVELYSDRATYFITMNEPQCFVGLGYGGGDKAPFWKVGYKDLFQITHNVLKAHGAAVKAMRAAAKRPIQIGYAPTCGAFYPATQSPEDIEAARKRYFTCPPLGRGVLWNVAWWSDPVLLGRYPEDGLEMYKNYLPEITPEDMELISQPLDFYGQNIYNGKEVRAGENGEPIQVDRKEGFPLTANKWPITPEALYWGPRFLYERYGLPISITENGVADIDLISPDGKIYDPNRIEFLRRYLGALEKATDDGVPLIGYFLWTFMDNYEWSLGYTTRHGIVYVDYETQQRIPKESAYWYKAWIETH